METWRSTEWEYFPLEWLYSLPFVLPSPPEHLVCESRPSQPVFMASTISWLDASSRGKEEEEEELGLRGKQRRSSFIFLCFASSLSRFLRRPHPWTEGSRIASRPLQLPVSVSISYFRQKKPPKTQIFFGVCLCQPFSQPITLQHKTSGCPWNAGTGLLVPFSPGKMLLGHSHPVLEESNSLFCTQMIYFLEFLFGPLWFWALFGFGPFRFSSLCVVFGGLFFWRALLWGFLFLAF